MYYGSKIILTQQKSNLRLSKLCILYDNLVLNLTYQQDCSYYSVNRTFTIATLITVCASPYNQSHPTCEYFSII